MVEIRRLAAAEGRSRLGDLADVLLDCVQGGASVSFMESLSKPEAETFFKKVLDGVESEDRVLLAAFVNAKLVGTVQVLLAMPPNQPHRGELAKLLVARSARNQGLGARLVEAAEEAARAAGKTLLVLDTVTGDAAERLYARQGWNRVGVIPKYALFPNGAPGDTTIFYKQLD